MEHAMNRQRQQGNEPMAPVSEQENSVAASGEPLEGSGFESENPEPDFEEEQ
jgi:hypothetical protein